MNRRWVWLVVATAACWIAETMVMLASGVPLFSAAAFGNAYPVVNFATVVGALVGAVILSRHPHHRIGWLFCWGQFGVAVGLLMRAISDGITSGAMAAPGWTGTVSDLVATLLGSQFALALLGLLLLLAPDGEPASRRWRPLLLILGLAYMILTVGVMLRFATGPTKTADVLLTIGPLGVMCVLVASVAGLVLRLRRSHGETRQQLRWIAAAAVVLAVAPVAAVVTSFTGASEVAPAWVILTLHLGYLGVPVATGMAVLRYRLYGIDRLMGGSVVLAVLAVLAFVGYVIAVGLIGLALPGQPADSLLSLLVFVSALLVFRPVRRLARRIADRFVYGPQAMSYDALTRFTDRLAATTDAPFLPAVAEAAGRLVNAQCSRAVLMLNDGTEQIATWSSESASEAASASDWITPIRHGDQEIGRLELAVPDFAAGAGRRRELLTSFADQVAGRFGHARLEQALRGQALDLDRLNRTVDRSRQQLLAARDIGRRQVADRIQHEVVTPLLPVLDHLAAVALLADRDVAAATGQVDAGLAATTTAIDRLRQITSTVYSRVLTEEGLAAALRAEARMPGVELIVSGAPRWPAAIESCLFASCGDLLGHASGQVVITLTSGGDQAEVRFSGSSYSGLSIDPDWIASTRERIEVLGGAVCRADDQLVLRLPLILDSPEARPRRSS